MSTETAELDLQDYVENMTEAELLERIDFLTNRAQETIRRGVHMAEFDGEDFPLSLVQETVDFIVEITTNVFPVHHFEVSPVQEGHLFNIHIHDEKKNTICDILFLTNYDVNKDKLSIADVFVTFKLGAFVAPKDESNLMYHEEETEDVSSEDKL